MTRKSVPRRDIRRTTATIVGAALVLSLGVLFALPSGQGASAEGPIKGCTPGFWINHPEAWVGYAPNQQFDSVFGFEVPGFEDLTLLDALSISGGDGYSLFRQGTAALLSAAHPDFNYQFSESTVISKVRDGADPFFVQIAGTGNDVDWEQHKDTLEQANERGCPL